MPNLKKVIVVGDRILIKPEKSKDKTKVGLYLPPHVEEGEKVHSGFVVKIGPGYPLPDFDSVDSEPWTAPKNEVRYIPLQAKIGDYAIFLRKTAVEIEYEDENYLIVPHSAILVLIREDFLEE